jgi:hypothetical protein
MTNDALVVVMHVSPHDWERAGFRERFQTELFLAGWNLVSVEAPIDSRPEYRVTCELGDEDLENGQDGPGGLTSDDWHDR